MKESDLAEAEAFGWVNTAAPKGKPAPAERKNQRPAAPDFSAIPALLQARDQWILWKLEYRAGRPTKVPYCVEVTDDGAQVKPASTTDPATWSTFEKIREEYERFVRFDLVSGIGFVFVEGDGIVGIDLDHQRDPVTGRWEDGILEKIRAFNSYAEISQSGAGAHVILLGEKPGTRCRSGDLEIYDAGRFFVMTGRHIPQTPSDLQKAAAGTLEAQYRQIDPGHHTVQPPARSSALPVHLEDAEVIRRAASALNGPKFTALYRAGDLAAYGGDHSAADLALCNLLAFWIRDQDQIDRIFRGSALMRPKWDEWRGQETYGAITIDKALSSSTSIPPAARATGTAAAGEDLDRQCKDYPMTDAGNGERFAARWGETTRYCHPRKIWLEWDGTHWREDPKRAVYRRAKETARAIYREADCERDDAKRPALAKWAAISEGKKRLDDMLFMASSEETIGIMPDELDADGTLFNLQNGTLELDTLTFREHRKEDLLTRVAGVAYDPAAACPLWDAHLRLIFGGKEDLIQAFQEHTGYCLLDTNPENVFEIWHGATGSNGKSVTLSTLRAVFGAYACHISADTFMESRQNSASARPDLMSLRGARLVTAVETDQGRRLAEGQIKAMTGGDPISARELFRNQETFPPLFTPILATNHAPVIRGMDGAIWRRIRLWPFTVEIPENQKIPNYDQRLAGEGSGILNWMLAGLRRYYAAGTLAKPPELVANTNAYRAQQDILKGFIPERCVTGGEERCLRTDLHSEYTAWCTKYSEETLQPKDFYQALREHNFEEKRGKYGRYFVGIRLKNSRELADFEKELESGDASYQIPL
jgi:putative DNA primase/helicase